MIPISVDLNKFTIEISEAKKVNSTVEIGDALILKTMKNAETGEYVDAKLLVTPDGGYLC